MAKKEADKKPAATNNTLPKRSKMLGVLLLLNMIGLVFYLKYAYIFFMLAVLPAFVALVTDLTPNRRNFQAVLACNLAGTLPYLHQMTAQNSPQIVNSIMKNPSTWLVVFASAGMGWVLLWACPHIMHGILTVAGAAEVQRRTHAQEKLVEEWGAEIKRRPEN